MKPSAVSFINLTLFPLITSLLLTSEVLRFSSAEGSSCTDNGPVHIILSEDGAHGQISDGEDAINSAHCEWLIERNETTLPGAFISITFIELATECSFDYVFVRDGGASNANSKLIGALSGIQNNVQLTSNSGKLYIHMFSDTNYFLKGFRANFSVSHCPNNCSGHGKCVVSQADPLKYVCECQAYPRYIGDDCSFRQCAEKCWQHKEHGECVKDTPGNGEERVWCKCHPGHIGETCSLNLRHGGEDIWYRLHSHDQNSFSGRMAFGAVYMEESKRVYTFGGFDLSDIKEDFLQYDFDTGLWSDVTLGESNKINPPALMGHTMTAINHEIVVIGGTPRNRNEARYVYYFNTRENTWSFLADTTFMPDVSGHTATLVGKCKIYVIGGRKRNYSYNQDVYVLDWCEKRWYSKVEVNGLKTSVLQLVGHSTVYVERYQSLFIFGGFTPMSIKSSERSSRLFVLKPEMDSGDRTPTAFLAEWATGNQTVVSRPPNIAYHTAVILGNYMVIFGGTAYSHKRDRRATEDDMCYTNDLYFLHLDCMLWTDKNNLSPSDKDLSIQSKPPSQRYGHVMLTLTNDVLVVIGGFDGTAKGDMYGFKASKSVVPSLTSDSSSGSGPPANPCKKVNNRTACLGHPECAWCRNKEGMGYDSCMHRNTPPKEGCGSEENFHRSTCPGICESLTDCQSCALWGAGFVTSFSQGTCGWCAHMQKCLPAEQMALCIESATKDNWKNYLRVHEDPRTNNVPFISSFDSCGKIESFRGFILEEYQFPVNGMLPDAVHFLSSSENYYNFELNRLYLPKSVWDYEKNKRSEEDYILYNMSFNLSFQTKERKEKFQLNLKTTRMKLPKMELANNEGYVEEKLCHGDSSAIELPCETQPKEAYSDVAVSMDQRLMPSQVNRVRVGFSLGLKLSSTNEFETLPSSYIFPSSLWSPEECNAQISCFGCLRNPACGWFSSSDNPHEARCFHKSATAYTLTISPQHCVNCSDFTTCFSCVAPSNKGQCIWWQKDQNSMNEEAPRCITSPPAGHAVIQENPTTQDECTRSCIERSSCSECTDDQDDNDSSHCAWCNDPPTCFPFQAYLVSFPYGTCRSWVDSKSPNVDNECSVCETHATCESCLSQYGCGYCYNQGQGRCVTGPFLSQTVDQNAFCLNAINTSVKIKGNWNYTYDQCPEENCQKTGCPAYLECKKNSKNKFECLCPDGLVLSETGKECVETCDPPCVNGFCTSDFVCKCNQGFTGIDCSVDCGCNRRANCTVVGQCGPCNYGYSGDFCENCAEMFFKNSDGDCQPCDCNGHGTKCDADGKCFCGNNTVGNNCEKCAESYYGDPRHGGICYKGCSSGQAVLTNAGVIYLGSKGGSEISNNRNMSSCFWKIEHKRQSSSQDQQPAYTPRMMLRITRINIMCNYQFVMVYDGTPDSVHDSTPENSLHGDSYPSRSGSGSPGEGLLGSFCGSSSDQSPNRIVIAKSGVMTIVLNTKKHEGTRKNSLQFFEAEITVLTSPCPNDHFVTDTDTGGDLCTCAPGWAGQMCEIPLCSDDKKPCANNGKCLQNGLCECQAGFWGLNCTEFEHASFERIVRRARWNLEYDGDLLVDSESSDKSRSGHSMIAVDNKIYIIGGYLSKSIQAPPRMLKFDIDKKTLDFFTNAGLHNNIHYSFSAAAHVRIRRKEQDFGQKDINCIYIYGGFGSGLSITGSMQVQYLSAQTDYSSHNSAPISDSSSSLSMNYVEVPNWVPKLVGHTMTSAKLGANGDKNVLVIIGGYSPEDGFNNMTIMYDVDRSRFIQLRVTGDYPLGLYCHSTVYYETANAFYIFGGLLYDTWGSQKVDLSGTLFLLKIEDSHDDPIKWIAHWTIMKHRDNRSPPKIMLHKAVIIKDYMLVLGGRTQDHDFTNQTYIYQFKCNTWLVPRVNLLENSFVNMGLWEPVIGHDAVAIDQKVYIYGGYNGRYLSRLVSLDLPDDVCQLLNGPKGEMNKNKCLEVSGCMYCEKDSKGQPCQRYDPKKKCESSLGKYCYPSKVDSLSSRARLKPACDQLSSCNECLARHPFDGSPSPCSWCKTCGNQKCIDKGKSCELPGSECKVDGSASDGDIFETPESCPSQNLCVAGSCAQCVALNRNSPRRNLGENEGSVSGTGIDLSSSLECVFTRNAKREGGGYGGAKLVINTRPIFDWSCQQFYRNIVAKTELNFADSTTLETCPKRCSDYTDCKSCLESPGGSDAGWRSCFWATGLDRCISPTFEPVLCLDGICDMVVRGSSQQCPKPCESFSRCMDCVNMRHCGYCSLQSSNEEIGGRGICLAGDLDGPNSEGGRCTSDSVISDLIKKRDESEHSSGSTSPIGQLPGEFDGLSGHQWGYQSCSDENECRNGHHDCDLSREVCIDCKRDKEKCPMGYLCECKEKYQRDETSEICEPQCDPPCGRNGTCLSPDVCGCDFGFAGSTCTEECKCNGNSNCDISKPPSDQFYCTECKFNTLSPLNGCSKCNATYYGDATNREFVPQNRCHSCRTLCNNKTSICYTKNLKVDENTLTVNDFMRIVRNEGPQTNNADDLKCFGCSGFTEGNHCEKCSAGYRKKKNDLTHFECVLCNCNYHGARNNSCNEDDGSGCQCTGHTMSPPNCHKDDNCRIHDQCTLCDDTDPNAVYIGRGDDGRQCYRKMHSFTGTFFFNTDNTRFVVENSSEQKDKHKLRSGEASFFYVKPQYRNVNIRITIEVTNGFVDVYMTKDRNIIRMRNSTMGPNVDQISLLDPLNENVIFSKSAKSVVLSETKQEDDTDSFKPSESNASVSTMPSVDSSTRGESSVIEPKRRRRSLLVNIDATEGDGTKSKSDKTEESEPQSGSFAQKLSTEKGDVGSGREKLFFYRVAKKHKANGDDPENVDAQQLSGDSLFLKLENSNSMLFASNITGRFIIELPHDKFDFKNDDFFLAIHNAQSTQPAYGIVYQQQKHNSWRVIHICTILCVGFIFTVLCTIGCYTIYIKCSQPQGFVHPYRNDMGALTGGGSSSPFVPVDFLFSEYNFKPQAPKSPRNASKYFTVDSRMRNKYTPAIIGYQVLRKNEKLRVASVMFELPGKNLNFCFGSALISVCDKFPVIETQTMTPSMTFSRPSATIGNPLGVLSVNGTSPGRVLSTLHNPASSSRGLPTQPLTVELPPICGPSRNNTASLFGRPMAAHTITRGSLNRPSNHHSSSVGLAGQANNMSSASYFPRSQIGSSRVAFNSGTGTLSIAANMENTNA